MVLGTFVWPDLPDDDIRCRVSRGRVGTNLDVGGGDGGNVECIRDGSKPGPDPEKIVTTIGNVHTLAPMPHT